MRKFLLIILLSSIALLNGSCQQHDQKSVLIIAADELTISDVLCNSDADLRSGFQLICNESIRFTHAFTTSTLTAPALSSILTGMYPINHGMHHNGAPGLHPDLELVSEFAFSKNFRTSFFSGGAPIFRKSGFNQGFEIFDDNIEPSFTYIYRPFKRSLQAFRSWFDKEVGQSAFFSVIYVPDLLHTNQETTSLLGDIRNLSYESQLNEFDEQLFDLIEFLKDKKRWNNTTVILVGLNGKTDNQRPKESAVLNLHGENTQVALFIKPVQKARDEAINWKIDQNVSLADLGKTLFEILGKKIPTTNKDSFQTYSLTQSFKSSEPDWPEERNLLIESGWAFWKGVGPIKIAVLNGYVLYINEQKPLLYNTLVDRQEINPLPLLQQSILNTTREIQKSIQLNGFVPFTDIPNELKAKLSIPFTMWTHPTMEGQLLQTLKQLLRKNPDSIDLNYWTALISLRRKDWRTLRELGEKNHIEIWSYVANKNLGAEAPEPADSCFRLLKEPKLNAENFKECDDGLFLEFVDWIRASARNLNRDTQRKRFEISYRNHLIDLRIQRFNIASGMIWDVEKSLRLAPSRAELALALPEYKNTLNQLMKSLYGDP